mmetsp:Transcript_5439/g.9177  ORF Transcript_5439/g.9177 Transcript_5439/m.9177 type:complete len:107 (-) Transcript_5439:210-530(-)
MSTKEFVFGNDPSTEDHYDQLENAYDPILFKKKKGAKHLFGVDLDMIVPSEGEVRLLGNRHKQCFYYSVGVDVCHTQMLKDRAGNFLACKVPIDGMWRCYTEEKYG